MLHDPELHEAYTALRALPPAGTESSHLFGHLNELTTITLLLLRALDNLGQRYTRDTDMLNATLQDNARLIQKALDHLHRQ